MTTTNRPRRRGREKALVAVAMWHQALPFSHAQSNCLRLVADVDRAMTGNDPMRGYRRETRSARGVARVMKRLGFRTVADALAATYPEVAPAMARRGDCGLVETASGELAAVIVLGDQVMGKSAQAANLHPARKATGATLLPRTRLVRAFRIG